MNHARIAMSTIVPRGFALASLVLLLAAGCSSSEPKQPAAEKQLVEGAPAPVSQPDKPISKTAEPARRPERTPVAAEDKLSREHARPSAAASLLGPLSPADQHPADQRPADRGPADQQTVVPSGGTAAVAPPPASNATLHKSSSAADASAPANPLRSGNDVPGEGPGQAQIESMPATTPGTGGKSAGGAAGEPKSVPNDGAELKPIRGADPTLTPIPPEASKDAQTPPRQGSELVIHPLDDPGRPAVVQGKPGRPHPSNKSTLPFDPIAENKPIFVDWPKPELALLITGRQDGYLEPCGCAGLDRMKGGMSRRSTLFQTLRTQGWDPQWNRSGHTVPDVRAAAPGKQGWPVLALDVGDIIKGFGPQTELKFQIAVDAMRQMGYDGISLGPTDLQLPAPFVLSQVADVNGQAGPFVSANVGLLAPDTISPYRIVAAAGKKIGITGVLGAAEQKQIRNAQVIVSDPAAALQKVVPEMKQKADYLILLANATLEESTALAKQFPQFDVVVTAGGPAEPPPEAVRLNGGKTRLIQVGEKGMNAIVLGLFADREHPVRYQRVPLDSRFAASTAMRQLMRAYQGQLKDQFAQGGFRGLGIHAVPHPQLAVLGRFVGSKACAACHDKPYKIWAKSGHAEAYATLANLNPPRNYDPECISCHVVGWDPGRFFPYQSGYESAEKTPHLKNVGCEDCHGPGEFHVAAENGHNVALQKKLQKAMRITQAEASDPRSGRQNCFTCHDGDNSPDFEFKTYWPLIEHKEE